MIALKAESRPRQGGFTLLELVVVAFLLGLFAALILPRFDSLMAQGETISSVRTLRAQLNRARREAVFEGDPRAFRFIQAGGAWELKQDERTVLRLPPGSRLECAKDDARRGQRPETDTLEWEFRPNGGSTGLRCGIDFPTGQHYVLDISRVLGRVRLRQG